MVMEKAEKLQNERLALTGDRLWEAEKMWVLEGAQGWRVVERLWMAGIALRNDKQRVSPFLTVGVAEPQLPLSHFISHIVCKYRLHMNPSNI